MRYIKKNEAIKVISFDDWNDKHNNYKREAFTQSELDIITKKFEDYEVVVDSPDCISFKYDFLDAWVSLIKFEDEWYGVRFNFGSCAYHMYDQFDELLEFIDEFLEKTKKR